MASSALRLAVVETKRSFYGSQGERHEHTEHQKRIAEQRRLLMVDEPFLPGDAEFERILAAWKRHQIARGRR